MGNSSNKPQPAPIDPIDLVKLTKALAALPKRCDLKCCQQHKMVVKSLDTSTNPQDSLLPLQKVAIDVKVAGPFATVDLDLTYLNPSTDCALEATYEFPLEKSTLLAKLVAELDGKTIEAQVREKQEAREKYDDAVARGNAAVLAERSNKDILMIKLGNLLPEKTLRLQVRLLMQLGIVNGSYNFSVPLAYFPDYSRHGMSAEAFPYEFSYKVSLKSGSKIQNLSIPEFAVVTS